MRLLLALSLLFPAYGFPPGPASRLAAQSLDVPVAIVRLHETVNIGRRELRQQAELLERQLSRSLSVSDRRELLDAQISSELINQAARRGNLRVTEAEIDAAVDQQRQGAAAGATINEFRALLKEQTGLGWQEYREQIGERLIQEKYIYESNRDRFERIDQPTVQEIRIFYEDNAPRFTVPTLVRFDHIFVDTRNTTAAEREERRTQAERLYSRVRGSSAAFDRLLNESLDDPSFGGGDFGYILRSDPQGRQQLGPEFIDRLFDLSEGEIGNRVLASNVGYHIVRITDRREPRLLGLDDPVLPGQSVTVRDQVRNFLILSKQQRLFQEVLTETVADLRRQADITVYEENLDW